MVLVLFFHGLFFGSIVWMGLDARKRDFSSSNQAPERAAEDLLDVHARHRDDYSPTNLRLIGVKP